MIDEAMKLPSKGRIVLQEKFNLSQRQARKFAKLLKGLEGEVEDNKIEFRQTNETAELSGQARTIDELLRKAEVDLDLWEVYDSEIKDNSWDVTMKNRDVNMSFTDGVSNGYSKETPGGITKTNKQFYIKIKLRPRKDFTATNKFRKEIIDEVKSYSPVVKLRDYKLKSTGNLLEVNIPDIHLGKLSWAEETGFLNYDIKIAVTRFENAFDNLLYKALQENKFEKVLFIVGNDLFNSDNAYPYPTTSRGTPQQDDARWQKSFREGRKMIVRAIEKLKLVAPVEVLVIPGNHDFQKAFYLGEVLEAKYYNDANVNVNNSPKTRKYFAWGKCLLGFAHGARKDEGEQRLFANLNHEAPKMLGINPTDMLYKEWHCGDIHHYKEVAAKGTKKAVDKYAEDIDGVVIKYLRTLMFNDEWESRSGYISQKGAHFFVWNKDEGNTVEYKYNRYD